MDLIGGCSHVEVAKCVVYIFHCYHSVCSVISRVPCTHLIGDTEIVLFPRKILNPIHVFLSAGFFSVPFRHPHKVLMPVPHDETSGALALPFTAYMHFPHIGCSRKYIQSTCQLAMTRRLVTSSVGCWLLGSR